jgi:ABC-type glycerol-3-phosphate transport system permease component
MTMLTAATLYFLLPVFWLVVAATKSTGDLTSTFGLWFADFHLLANLRAVAVFQDGVFFRWLGNSALYSIGGATIGTLLAPAAGRRRSDRHCLVGAAAVDGQSVIFLFQFVAVWNNFLLPLVMLSSNEKYPVTLGRYTLNTQLTLVPELKAIVVTGPLLSVLPLIIAFLCLQRFWRSGLAAGSVKA